MSAKIVPLRLIYRVHIVYQWFKDFADSNVSIVVTIVNKTTKAVRKCSSFSSFIFFQRHLVQRKVLGQTTSIALTHKTKIKGFCSRLILFWQLLSSLNTCHFSRIIKLFQTINAALCDLWTLFWHQSAGVGTIIFNIYYIHIVYCL